MLITRPEDVGALVRDRRRQLKLSQTDLAQRLHVSQRYISHLERGKPTLQLGLVIRVLRELGVVLQVNDPSSPSPRRQPAKQSGRKRPTIDIDRLVDD
jgi:y4mF family transcriptional regulator